LTIAFLEVGCSKASLDAHMKKISNQCGLTT